MKTIGRAAVMTAVAVAFVLGPVGPGVGADLLGALKAKAKAEATTAAKKKVTELLKSKKPQAPKDVEDTIMGEYAGTFTGPDGKVVKAEAKVAGYGQKDKVTSWDVVLLAPPVTTDKQIEGKVMKVELKAQPTDQGAAISGQGWSGTICAGALSAKSDKGTFEMKAAVRKSPTLCAKPPAGAVVLLPYAEGDPPSLAAWSNKKWVALDDGSMLRRGGSTMTNESFSSFKLHIEFRCPYEPHRTGQGRGNSGVYFHGKYEVQVLDSFGLVSRMGDCGAIYGVRIPSFNASLPPTQWQTYDVTYHAPKFGADGKMTRKPTFEEVRHNGLVIHKNVEVGKTTTAGMGGAAKVSGPIMLQDHGNDVRYRNIWLVPIND
jgi:hypothetical protein